MYITVLHSVLCNIHVIELPSRIRIYFGLTYLFVEVRVLNSIFTWLHRIVSWACVAILLPFLLLFAVGLLLSAEQKSIFLTTTWCQLTNSTLFLFSYGKMLEINCSPYTCSECFFIICERSGLMKIRLRGKNDTEWEGC